MEANTGEYIEKYLGLKRFLRISLHLHASSNSIVRIRIWSITLIAQLVEHYTGFVEVIGSSAI